MSSSSYAELYLMATRFKSCRHYSPRTTSSFTCTWPASTRQDACSTEQWQNTAQLRDVTWSRRSWIRQKMASWKLLQVITTSTRINSSVSHTNFCVSGHCSLEWEKEDPSHRHGGGKHGSLQFCVLSWMSCVEVEPMVPSTEARTIGTKGALQHELLPQQSFSTESYSTPKLPLFAMSREKQGYDSVPNEGSILKAHKTLFLSFLLSCVLKRYKQEHNFELENVSSLVLVYFDIKTVNFTLRIICSQQADSLISVS